MVSNREAVHFISELIDEVPLHDIGERLIADCTIPIDPDTNEGSDNMTVIIAVLNLEEDEER